MFFRGYLQKRITLGHINASKGARKMTFCFFFKTEDYLLILVGVVKALFFLN